MVIITGRAPPVPTRPPRPPAATTSLLYPCILFCQLSAPLRVTAMMIHHNRRTLTNTAIADLFDRVLNATHPRVAVPSRFPLPFGRVMGAHPLAQVHPVFLYNFPPPCGSLFARSTPTRFRACLPGCGTFSPIFFPFFPLPPGRGDGHRPRHPGRVGAGKRNCQRDQVAVS